MEAPTAAGTAHTQVQEITQKSEIERWLLLVSRRKWIIVATLLLAAAGGAIYYRMAPRIYQSTASVLVVETGAAMAAAQMGDNTKPQDHIPTHIRLILSPAVLNTAVTQLEKEEADEVHQLPPGALAGALARSLQVGSDNETKVIDISYRTTEPASAARIVDAVVSAYLQFVNEAHRNTAQDILNVLTQQKDMLEKQLVQKESQLQKLQQEAGVMGLRDNQTNMLAAKFASLNEALTKARLHRMETEAKLKSFCAAVKANQPLELLAARYAESISKEIFEETNAASRAAGQADHGPDGGEKSADKLLLDRYSQVYGPNHPRMQEVQARLKQTSSPAQRLPSDIAADTAIRQQAAARNIERFLEQELLEDQTLEADFEKKLEADKAQALTINNRNVQLIALETEVERMRKLFEVVINRIKDAGLGGNYEQVRARVISPPTRPQSPVSPKLTWVAMVSLCIGLGSGLGLCQVCEWLDSSFRGPDDIKWRMGLPILSHVPHIPNDEGRELWSHEKPRSTEAEAFRTLRTAIAFSNPMPQRLVVTSPEPGDGKTSLACNLAVVFAQSGRRTLIIDADLRRPRIRDIFGAERSGGVCGLLRNGSATPHGIAAEIQPSGIENLSLLCSGPHPPNPAELLTSPKFQDVLDWASQHFDQVIIDSPPVLAVTDASILGRAGDAVLLVLKPDKNDRHSAVRARDTLISMGCRIVGMAVNDVHPSHTYGYYYYGYGRYGYGYKKYGGYGNEEAATEGEFIDKDNSELTAVQTRAAA